MADKETKINSSSQTLFFSVIQIIFLFILPVALLYFGLLPKETRLIILGLFTFLVMFLLLHDRPTFLSLGIRTDNIKKSIIPYLVFTIGGIFFISLLAKMLGFSKIQNWQQDFHFIFLFLPISLAQEFLYRSFLFYKLQRITHSALAIIFVNTILFGFLHIIYPNALIMLPLAIVSGAGFSMMYLYYPNLYLISLSHAVLNFAATLYAFFSF